MNMILYVKGQAQLRLSGLGLKEANELTNRRREIEALSLGSHQVVIDNRRLRNF